MKAESKQKQNNSPIPNANWFTKTFLDFTDFSSHKKIFFQVNFFRFSTAAFND
jgi:hypothetical protein